MKRAFILFVIISILSMGLFVGTITASASETINLYSLDGRMATIPISEAENWKAAGWYDCFPYYGKEVWATNAYLEYDTVDIYGTECDNLLSLPKSYNKIAIKWYDDSDFTQINGNEKVLKTLIFELNGGEYKMPFGDFLRGRADYDNFTQLFWEYPKTYYHISDEDWNDIQDGYIWTGMSKDEFLLEQMCRPDDIKTYECSLGTIEIWRYDSDSSYYDFVNGSLSSW